MAALAAAAALSAFLRQRKEVIAQEFDRNFFTLLANLQSIIAEIDVRRSAPETTQDLWQEAQDTAYPDLYYDFGRLFTEHSGEVRGRDALRALLRYLRFNIGDPSRFSDSKQVYRRYSNFYDLWYDDLGHYFRTLYHIFKLIDEECPKDKKKYVRIARSHLSSSEIVLLAYNCAVGEGRHRFKKYLIDFELLNNYHMPELSEFYLKEFRFFERKIGTRAFGDRESSDFIYE